MKICKKCGVVVEDDAVFICPKCGAGRIKKKSQKKSKELLMSVDAYYSDVLPEDAGQVEQKQNNTGLYVKCILNSLKILQTLFPTIKI